MRHVRCGPFHLDVPTTRRERVRGLRGRSQLPPGRGILFTQCRSVHTFGMSFAIDVVLLDARGRPIRTFGVPPRRLVLPRPGVRHIAEVGDGQGPRLSAALASRDAALGGPNPWP